MPRNERAIEEWTLQVSARCPSVRTPGYWPTLEENCQNWAREVSVSQFWHKAKEMLPDWAAQFRAQTSGNLVPRQGLPDFKGKGMPRLQSKAYRDSAHDRGQKGLDDIWPHGVHVPNLDDMVRARIECSYLDGVPFLTKKLFDLAQELKVSPEQKLRGLIGGYFAQHIYFQHRAYFRFGGGEEAVTIMCEIQVGTTLAKVIWEAGHDIYEQSRE